MTIVQIWVTFVLNCDGYMTGSEHRQNGRFCGAIPVCSGQWLQKSGPRKDNWWTCDRAMGSQGHWCTWVVNTRPSGPIPQKSYCSTICWESKWWLWQVSEHTVHYSLLHMGLHSHRPKCPCYLLSTAESGRVGEDYSITFDECNLKRS